MEAWYNLISDNIGNNKYQSAWACLQNTITTRPTEWKKYGKSQLLEQPYEPNNYENWIYIWTIIWHKITDNELKMGLNSANGTLPLSN